MRLPLCLCAAGAAALLAACGGSSGGATAGRGAPSTPASTPASTLPSTAAGTPAGTPASTVTGSPASGLEAASADEILAATQKAFSSARSVHLAGTFGRGGQSVKVDLRLARGAGATGTVTVGGKPVQVLRIGTTAYLRGGAALYGSRLDAATAQQLAGKWLKMTASSKGFSSLLQLTDFTTFARNAFRPTGSVGTGTATTVAGRRAVELRDGDGSTLAVSLDGPAYPLRLTAPTSAGPGQGLTFTDYGAAVPLAPPPASQVVAAPST